VEVMADAITSVQVQAHGLFTLSFLLWRDCTNAIIDNTDGSHCDEEETKYLKKKIKSSRTPNARRYHWMTQGGDAVINDQFGKQSTSA